jgi:hypothetical protein
MLHRLTDLFVRERWATPRESSRAPEEVEALWPSLRNNLLRLFIRRFRI